MENNNNNLLARVLELNSELNKANNGSFVGVNNYLNSKGELSNNLINAKITYGDAKKEDTKVLQGAKAKDLVTPQFNLELTELALEQLTKAMLTPSKGSKSQTDAYKHLDNGLRIHKGTNIPYIYGFANKKTILVEGEYKQVNSKPLTLCKKHIKKALELKTPKFRQFDLSKAEFKLNKKTI